MKITGTVFYLPDTCAPCGHAGYRMNQNDVCIECLWPKAIPRMKLPIESRLRRYGYKPATLLIHPEDLPAIEDFVRGVMLHRMRARNDKS